MQSKENSLKLAYFAIHLAALFFGLAGIFGYLISASAEFITMARALFAVLVLFLISKVTRSGIIPTTLFKNIQSCIFLIGAVLFLALHWFSFFIAVKKGGVALATLGFASFPAFTMVIEFLLRQEIIQKHDILAITAITLGLILVNPSLAFHTEASIGLFWGIISGFSFALFTTTNKQLSLHAAPLQIALWQNLGVVVLMLPWSILQIPTTAIINWFWAALLGIFCTAFAHYLIIYSLQSLKARHAGIVIALEPVYAIIFAAILFQQYPSLRIIIGATIIIGTIIWNQNKQQNNAA